MTKPKPKVQLVVMPGRANLNVMVPVAQVLELLQDVARLVELPAALVELHEPAELYTYRARCALLAGAVDAITGADNPARGLLDLPGMLERGRAAAPVFYETGPV